MNNTLTYDISDEIVSMTIEGTTFIVPRLFLRDAIFSVRVIDRDHYSVEIQIGDKTLNFGKFETYVSPITVVERIKKQLVNMIKDLNGIIYLNGVSTHLNGTIIGSQN